MPLLLDCLGPLCITFWLYLDGQFQRLTNSVKMSLDWGQYATFLFFCLSIDTIIAINQMHLVFNGLIIALFNGGIIVGLCLWMGMLAFIMNLFFFIISILMPMTCVLAICLIQTTTIGYCQTNTTYRP